MANRIHKAFLFTFTFLWCFIVLLEYWSNHPAYSQAFRHMQHFDLLFVWLLLGGIFVWRGWRWKNVGYPVKYVNGLLLFGLSLLIILLSTLFFAREVSLDLLGGSYGFLLFRVVGTATGIYLVILTCAVTGALTLNLFSFSVPPARFWIYAIALGICLIVLLLFVLGAFSLLWWWALYPVFALILLWNWRFTLEFIQLSLWMPFPVQKEINMVGLSSLWLLLLLLSVNFAEVIRPFPLGWDAISLYMNLASLVQDYHALVVGYQAYNWSLFMSLGYLLFGQAESALALSFVGGPLSLIALYHLSRRWLDVNFSLLGLVLFYSLPLMGWFSFRDMKVDLGLLFFSLCILLVWLDGKVTNDGVKETKRYSFRLPAWVVDQRHLILAGIFTGFSFGIKYTAILLLVGVLAVIWFRNGKDLGFWVVFFLSFFIVSFLRLDDMGGMRQYHLLAGYMIWGLLAAAVVFMVLLFLRDREAVWKSIRSSLVYLAFFAVTFLPWGIKNFSETGSLSPDALLYGKKTAPVIDLNRR